MKLIAKKNGKGYISSYTLNVSLSLARESNLINEDGSTKDVQLVVTQNGIHVVPLERSQN